MSKIYHDCWKYFNRSADRNVAVCNICQKSLSCKASSTTGLHRHLEGMHNMRRNEADTSETGMNPTSSKRLKHESMKKFLVRSTLDELVAKLAATDGISIHAITKSEFIRQSMSARGFDLPKNPSDVMNLVYQYYDKAKQEVLNKIQKIKSENKKISISIDEWTSFKNRRYLNVHVYFNREASVNLGLIRVEGSCPAEKAIELVRGKLQDFDLSFTKDVVSTSSDGASVMKKFGRLSPAFQQLCYNHALHLAVTKTFYVKKDKTAAAEVSGELSDSDEDEHAEIEVERFSEEEIDIEVPQTGIFFTDKIDKTIKRIRKNVKLFKNSPVRNSVLQKHVVQDENMELELLLDSIIRWNTLETMLERYLRIKLPIKKALHDLKLSHLWKQDDIDTANDILSTLKPVRIAVEALSRKDATLLTAEGVLKFLFQSLDKQKSDLSLQLLKEIKIQISERRDKQTVSLMKFLYNPDCLRLEESEKTDPFFKMSPKTEMVNLAKSMLKRLFTETSCSRTGNICGNSRCEEVDEVNSEEMNLDQQLNLAISKSLEQSKPCDDEFRSVIKELNIYECTGKITPNLKLLMDALFTIKPTSTENERNFSVAGNFVSKRRTRLSDKAVDALCFLKQYFINQN